MAEAWHIEDAGSVTLSRAGTGDRVCLVLSGVIDRMIGDELAAAVRRALLNDLPVDVDTRAVTFMDSSGLAALAQLAYSARSRPTFLAPPEMVRFLLEVTNIDSMVDIVEPTGGEHPAAGAPAPAPVPAQPTGP